MILDLVSSDDAILKQKCEPFDFEKPQHDPEKLSEDLKESMIHHRGIGLSACQVGIPLKVFAVGDPNDPENIVVMFNPRIVDFSQDTVLIEEGCLSYPGMFIKIKRSNSIRLRYYNESGDIVTQAYDGIPARAIQHEYDHMDGITFHTRASSFHLDQAKRQKKKLDKIRKRNYNKAK